MIETELGVSCKKENIEGDNVKYQSKETNRRNSKKRDISSDNLERKSISDSKNIGQFILGDKLGEGTFGVVRMATHILTGEKVAVKILEKIKILGKDDKTRLEREIKILKCLRHNNIVQLYSVIQTVTTIYLIMEYASGKELFDYIVLKKRLSEAEACKFYQQLLYGIEYLSKLRIVHRDLKPENLLLDHKKDLKIADFGLSNLYNKGELLKTACGSPCYAAPEMIANKRYSGVMVDIWSSGIILYAMICGYLPFEDPDNSVLYKKITDGKFSIPNFVSEAGKDLIKKILNTDPSKRYTISQIKSHPWFNAVNPRLNTNEGLLINLHVIPIDESLIKKMEEYDFNKEEVRINVLCNRHSHVTTTYYLLLKYKIRKGNHSVADLISDEFKEYINDSRNLLSKYNNDFNNVLQERASSKNRLNYEERNNIGAANPVEEKERHSNVTSKENLSNNNSNLTSTNKVETPENSQSKTNTSIGLTNLNGNKSSNKNTNKIPIPDRKSNGINQNANKISQSNKRPSNDKREENQNDLYLTTEVINKVHNEIKEIENYNSLSNNQSVDKSRKTDNNMKETSNENRDNNGKSKDSDSPQIGPNFNNDKAKNTYDKFIKKQINSINLNDKNSIELKSIHRKIHNKRNNANKNFFNTSMSFDQNADAKNTTFDQEIIKKLETKDRDSKVSKIEKEKAHYKPLGSIKDRDRDKFVDSSFNSNNIYQASMTETNYCEKKTIQKFAVIKEEEEFAKNLNENKRGVNNISPIRKNVKFNNLNSTYNKPVSPKKSNNNTNSYRNSVEKQKVVDNKTTIHNKISPLGNSLGFKNEYKSNMTQPIYKHQKTFSEPYAEKYIVAQNNKVYSGSKSPMNKTTNIHINNYMKMNIIPHFSNQKKEFSGFSSNNKYIINTEINVGGIDPLSKTSYINSNYVKKSSGGNKLSAIPYDEIKTINGPFDLSCMFFKSPKKLKEDLTKILNLNKISYKNQNNFPFKYLCDKNGLKFEVEINKLSDLESCFIMKFKKLDGSLTMFRDICKLILMKISC